MVMLKNPVRLWNVWLKVWKSDGEFMDLSKKAIVIVCLVIAILCGGIIAATLFSEPEVLMK